MEEEIIWNKHFNRIGLESQFFTRTGILRVIFFPSKIPKIVFRCTSLDQADYVEKTLSFSNRTECHRRIISVTSLINTVDNILARLARLLLIESFCSHPLTEVHLKTKFKFAIENKLRSFQFKLLHDIIPRNQRLWKMNFYLFCRTFFITNKTLGSQLGIINAFSSSALWIAQTKDPFLPQYIYKLCRSYMQQPVAKRKQYYPVKVKEKTSCTFQSISILTEQPVTRLRCWGYAAKIKVASEVS